MANIQKRPDGRWRARYRDPSGREHARHFSRKVDAQRWLDETAASVLTGTYADPKAGRITVGEWASRWIAGRVNLKPKTLIGYESLLRSRVLPRWADVPLMAVTHSEGVAWVADMQQQGLSASRTRQAYHLLNSMLDDAVKDRRLVVNPITGVCLPRLPATGRRYLTHGQVTELAQACTPYEVLVLVLAYCGLRWGEASALRVQRVDLSRRRLEIVEAVVDVNGRMVVGPPKSHQSRSVAIPRFLVNDLATQLAGKHPDELVFQSPAGALLRVQNWRRRYFDPAAAQSGMAGLLPHELRHTAASLAIGSGANVKAVQMMLGHASAAMTLDRYGHLFDDELDAVADRMSAARADFLRTEHRAELATIRELSR